MIFDQQNMFFDATPVAASMTSDVIANAPKNEKRLKGTQDAEKQQYIFIQGIATGTARLETSETEDFATPVPLATYNIPQGKSRLPIGVMDYMRLVIATTETTGTVTAGLVTDVNHG